jgi:predicted permease
VDTATQDLKFALRSLARNKGFAAAAVMTLALGIGAAVAIFSVANGVLLRPLPYGAPDRVVTVWASWDNFPDKTWLSIQEYQLFHQENRTLADLALYSTASTTFTSVESPEWVGAAFVTPNTFDVLGVSPILRRVFTWEEARDPATAGVLLAHSIWERRYGADATVLGRTIELDGVNVQVLGVLPEGFVLPVDYASPSPSEVFYARFVDLESPAPDLAGGGSHGSYGVGRLVEGATVDDARADFDRVMSLVDRVGLYSPERRFAPRVFGAREDIVGSARTTILVLLGAVGLLLLIACGNVANLLLSRSEARTGEVAVRTALGAGRARIVRQLLTESVVIASCAGVLGLGIAWAGIDALLAVDPAAVPRSEEVRIDGVVALFTLGIVLVTALLFGLVPALRVARSGLARRLRGTGRRDLGGGSGRLQGLLVASQMAMAVVLLTASGLMMKSFVGLLRVDPGVGAENVLTLRITVPQARYPGAESVARFYEDLLARIEDIPGISSAAAVRLLPLASTMGTSFFRPVGYEAAPNEGTQGDWQWATPGYFETMGIPLLEGRTFEPSDRRDAQAVVVVNRALARRFWGEASPLGTPVLAGGGDTAVVVGVVGDVRHGGITADATPGYYKPLSQVGVAGSEGYIGSMRSMTLTIATEGEPLGFLAPVRSELRALDPTMPVSQVRTLDDVSSASLAQSRFALVLLGAFGALALILAVVGIYGVLAYAVSRRTPEIGIRMALGAEPGQVVGMVVRQGLGMAVAGVAAGTGAAWLLAGLMSGLLYGVAPQDPVTLVSVPALFTAVALFACWVPAARASRIRPASALRYD